MDLRELILLADKAFPNDGVNFSGPLALSPKNGDIPSNIIIIGEAPGRLGAGHTGIPFFSTRNEQSAARFSKLMAELGADCDAENGWQGHGVFVTDVVLRHPVRMGKKENINRGTTKAELRASLELLRLQIALLLPRVIVALGRKACWAVSELYEREVKIDGQFHQISGIEIVGCPHPSPHVTSKKNLVKIQDEVFETLQSRLRSPDHLR
jgi:uracil-DNA glycosylase family 4